jgi:predicted TIM-barrel fold metal-dependent hydrolase
VGGAAANFPDINFVILHVGLPFLDETCWQLIRYPNLYACIPNTTSHLTCCTLTSPANSHNIISSAASGFVIM